MTKNPWLPVDDTYFEFIEPGSLSSPSKRIINIPIFGKSEANYIISMLWSIVNPLIYIEKNENGQIDGSPYTMNRNSP